MAATPSHGISVHKSRGTAIATPAAQLASSPHTPLSRSVSASLYNSPSGRFRVDDENLLIFEIGARVLRAGFAGEAGPRCEISYGPEQLRRLGDYRHHGPNYKQQSQTHSQTHDVWSSHDYDLWQPDLRDLDLSFVGERIERLVREVETTYLMLDTRQRKVNLVISSQMPKLLLEVTLSALFNVLQGPAVTILASNVMSVMSSGLRSALVIDIGWSETTISSVFEFREVSCHKTIKAAKLLTKKCSTMAGNANELTLKDAEDLLVRMAWCRGRNEVTKGEEEVTIESDGRLFPISRSALASLVEKVFFTNGENDHQFDDHDLPIHLLAHQSLMQLPIDVRKICMSRIVVVGGASHIPGLKSRLVQELQHLVSTRGWNPIKNCGSATGKSTLREDALREATANTINSRPANGMKMTEKTTDKPHDVVPTIPAHALPQERDEFMEKIIARNNTKHISDVQGVLRCVHSLGPWAGASLMVGLRLRGAIEIERDKFLSSGLMGSLIKTNVPPRSVPGTTSEVTGPSLPPWL